MPIALLALLPLAHATSGVPLEIQVLGWEPVDQKVYLLEHGYGEPGSPPQLSYLDRDGPDPDALIQVRSCYRLDENTLYDRLEQLEARLVPLEPLALTGLQSTERVTSVGPCADASPLDDRRCQQVDVALDWYGLRAELQIETWGQGHVHGAWAIPGTEEPLVVYRHVGVTWESGYTRDHAVVLTAPPAAPGTWPVCQDP